MVQSWEWTPKQGKLHKIDLVPRVSKPLARYSGPRDLGLSFGEIKSSF